MQQIDPTYLTRHYFDLGGKNCIKFIAQIEAISIEGKMCVFIAAFSFYFLPPLSFLKVGSNGVLGNPKRQTSAIKSHNKTVRVLEYSSSIGILLIIFFQYHFL